MNMTVLFNYLLLRKPQMPTGWGKATGGSIKKNFGTAKSGSMWSRLTQVRAVGILARLALAWVCRRNSKEVEPND